MAVSLTSEHEHVRKITQEQLEAKLAEQKAKYGRYVCEECIVTGTFPWVHLRACLTCGHVGCCDTSPHQHAHKHFVHKQLEAGENHPLMQSVEPGESWMWCYIHDDQCKEVKEEVSV